MKRGSVEAEQQSAAAEARESGELLVLAKRASGAGTFDLDMRTATVRYCPRSLEMLGHSPDRPAILTVDEWAEHIFPGDAKRVLAEGLLARDNRTDFVTEYRIVAPDGAIRWIRGMGRTLFDAAGEPIRCVGFNFDITEEKKAETAVLKHQSELVHAARANAMATMAESLANELNQPLTAISSYLSGARSFLGSLPDGQAKEVRQVFVEVIAAARRASDIVRNLRALTRRGNGEPGVTSVDVAIRKALDLALVGAADQGIDVQCDLAGGLVVAIDDLQIQQVVYNLVRNAVEASEASTAKTIAISCRRENEDALIRVQDGGGGVSEGDRVGLFELFVTTKADRAGLGLAISRTIVEAHGGRLWAEHLDSGTAFCLAVPLAGDDRQRPALEGENGGRGKD